MKDIFLCHTGADKAWVENLAGLLESETANGSPISVFLDKWDIDVGENIVKRLDDGLRESRFLAVVLSPAMTKAPWPNAEWQSRFFSDPSGRDLRILPLLLHKYDPESGEAIDIPMFLRPLRYIDFTGRSAAEVKKNARLGFAELLRILRGERPRRGAGGTSNPMIAADQASGGDRHLPDSMDEILLTNLLPIVTHPTTIWSDLTTAQTYPEVWKTITGNNQWPFRLDGGRLYSFFPPSDNANPFRRHLTGSDERSERPVDWLADVEKSKVLVGLYNSALREHCFHLRIHTPEKAVRLARKTAGEPKSVERSLKRKRTQFYCPIFDGKPRLFRWKADSRARSLSKILRRPDGTSFGVHKSARLKFVTVGDEGYLQIEPGWMFTEDGVIPLEGPNVTRFSTLWGGKERNKSVITNVLQWGLMLSRGHRTATIALGAETLVVQAVPASAHASVGLSDDTLDIQRMLGGEGAGESAYSDEDPSVTAEDDLEEIATAVFGANIPDRGSATTVEKRDEGEDNWTGDADGTERDDDSDELRLPF